MKKIYLTFDMETIVSRLSFNPNIYTNLMLGSLYIAKELEKKALKATFFISLAPKTDVVDTQEYIENAKMLIRALNTYKNIKLQPHIHMKNLPLSFDTPSDLFSDYTLEQQVEALTWAKNIFNECGVKEIDSFRPGSYSANEQYYNALTQAGYKYSSIMIKENIHYDMITQEVTTQVPYKTDQGIIEYPVTSLRFKSIKGKEETINLSPDFFTYNSIKEVFEKSNYINVNFHSFSIFTNRLARENHPKQLINNLKYFFFEKPLIKVLKLCNFELINHQTLFKTSFDNWLVQLEAYKNSTYVIGE